MASSTTKKTKTRNRKPVPPKFHLPPRGPRCINWISIAKREIRKRIHDLGRHRLQVVEISINNTISQTFDHFEIPKRDNLPTFTLQYELILNNLIKQWDEQLLSKWNGPKLKQDGWQNKLWEGTNGYWKLCKNWADQFKYICGDIFWCHIFKQIHIYIHKIQQHQPYMNNSQLFTSCLLYACFYGIFAAEVGFPKTRRLPLLVNTIIAKNVKVRKYLRECVDAGLRISAWKEQESEKYDGMKNASTENNICAAVRQQCIDYTADRMNVVFNEYYKSTHLHGNSPCLDWSKFRVSVVFDAKGNIKKRVNSCKTPTSSNTKDKDDADDEDDSKMDMISPNDSNNNDNHNENHSEHVPDEHKQESSEMARVNTSTATPIRHQISAPEMDYLTNAPMNDSYDYGATHGPSFYTHSMRSNPIQPIHAQSPMRSDLVHTQNALSQAQRTNASLRAQIAECRAILSRIHHPMYYHSHHPPHPHPHHHHQQNIPYSPHYRHSYPHPYANYVSPPMPAIDINRASFIPNHHTHIIRRYPVQPPQTQSVCCCNPQFIEPASSIQSAPSLSKSTSSSSMSTSRSSSSISTFGDRSNLSNHDNNANVDDVQQQGIQSSDVQSVTSHNLFAPSPSSSFLMMNNDINNSSDFIYNQLQSDMNSSTMSSIHYHDGNLL